jgi:acetyl esterase/lipase
MTYTIPLYPDQIPNSIPGPDEETPPAGTDAGLIFKVSRPTLGVYLPATKTTTSTPAVVVCPGGGYGMLSWDNEGKFPAMAFQDIGVAAFLLKYRLPDDNIMKDKSIGPLQDAQRAIKLIRMHAKEWNVDPGKVGILGFSAGGHLASTAATHFSLPYIPNPEKTSLRPDFQILVYPVISFTNPKLTHFGSMAALIGLNASDELKKTFSNERQISEETPPAFLVHSADDGVVPVGNSIEFFNSLHGFGTAASMHVYEKGGHGFGLVNPDSKMDWFPMVADWMCGRRLLDM